MNFFSLNIILKLVVDIGVMTAQNEFKILKNKEIKSCGSGDLISELFKQSRTMCMATCRSDSFCLTAVFNNQNRFLKNCFLFNRYFSASERISSSASTIYVKKLNSYFYFFTFGFGVNALLFSNTNPTIQECMNIEKVTINNIQYNLIVDYNVGIFLNDSNWKYNYTFNKARISYAIASNGHYYFTDAGNYHRIIKTSFYSPTVLNWYGTGYRGLYYDSIGSRIIAAGCDSHRVDMFDFDLNLNS